MMSSPQAGRSLTKRSPMLARPSFPSQGRARSRGGGSRVSDTAIHWGSGRHWLNRRQQWHPKRWSVWSLRRMAKSVSKPSASRAMPASRRRTHWKRRWAQSRSASTSRNIGSGRCRAANNRARRHDGAHDNAPTVCETAEASASLSLSRQLSAWELARNQNMLGSRWRTQTADSVHETARLDRNLDLSQGNSMTDQERVTRYIEQYVEAGRPVNPQVIANYAINRNSTRRERKALLAWIAETYPAVYGGMVEVAPDLFAERACEMSYTTAPEAYDGFGTEELAVVGTCNGKPLRKVETPVEHVAWQRGRYWSGMHATYDEAEFLYRQDRPWFVKREESAHEG